MTPPPFDPELAPVVEMLRALRPPLASLDDIPGRRELNAAEHRTVEELAAAYPAHKVAEEHAGDVPLLVMTPESSAGVLYYVHGGGTIVGSHLGADVPNLLAWAGELDLTIVSPGYRLAPEHPYPAPVEDCYAGLVWTAERFAGPLVLGGISAGGGLAAATALLARDRGGPSLAGQLLLCPMLDDRNDTASAVDLDGRGLWDRTANNVGWTAYLGGLDEVPAYAAAARAADLSGLPPAFLDVGTAETFRDEVVAYASRLWQAGGEAELHVWPGGFHGFDSLAPEARLSRAARAARLTWLRRLLGQ
ncbi:Acetyl esterase/lipase [Amycolatopsis pretoriensis]|uniref:Acetyl esterase/lipase n=1 Tax=Amycolatopsis pretoriensis TaxID=218821 RepID=A0A1H5RFK0_9PSEU|nr:alpha/beta hydrolase fold domain-containing protein [Amycolatopsis pretoriensis]SEF37182.1 Acetyl esterase/lipase [Amycolatopsis pretoriensis]